VLSLKDRIQAFSFVLGAHYETLQRV
jgi:hypothetical protein